MNLPQTCISSLIREGAGGWVHKIVAIDENYFYPSHFLEQLALLKAPFLILLQRSEPKFVIVFVSFIHKNDPS